MSPDPSSPLFPRRARVIAIHHVSGPENTSTTNGIRLGDAFHAIALPIARAMKLPCVDPATKQLRPESNCAERRARWNKRRLL